MQCYMESSSWFAAVAEGTFIPLVMICDIQFDGLEPVCKAVVCSLLEVVSLGVE